MPLARRLPKRGFTNIFRKEYQIVNLDAIAALELDTIDPKVLADNGLVRSSLKPVKILGRGELASKIKVTASAFSQSAIDKINKAGGTATIL